MASPKKKLTPGKPTEPLPCTACETVIEFRPMLTWKGEFGFDWMRVYEGNLTEHHDPQCSATWNVSFLLKEEMPYIDGASDAATEYYFGPYESYRYPGTISFFDRPTPPLGTGIVWGGFDGSPLLESSPARMQKLLQKEYESFKIIRGKTPTYRLSTYFVPWLNLFPEPDAGVSVPVDMLSLKEKENKASILSKVPLPLPILLLKLFSPPPKIFSPPPRICEAELQVLYDIKNASPQKIVIEFDKDCIEVNGDATGKYELPPDPSTLTPPLTPASYFDNVVQHPQTLKIKCVKGVSDPKGSQITVRAFDKHAKPDDEGRIAGKLIVCPNSREMYQKKIKIILVCVKTNINSTIGETTGAFTPEEIERLFCTLHQALIHPDIINLDESGKEYELDLSAVPEFHDPKRYASGFPPGTSPGKFVSFNHIPGSQHGSSPEWMIRDNHDELHRFLFNKFNATRKTPITDRFFIFAFGNGGDGFSGKADGNYVDMEVPVPVGHPNNPLNAPKKTAKVTVKTVRWRPFTALFKERSDIAAAHETLHSLTLRHTHRDWGVPALSRPYATSTTLSTTGTADFRYLRANVATMSVRCKYFFPFRTTTNVMSYSTVERNSTWHWQWAIMRANVDIAPDDLTLGKEEKLC